ncbi:MAG: DNA cytosine methyltransferase, partial [Gemmatimonadales bacterium]
IGDRPAGKQLKDRTLERIRYGLEKYGRRELLVRTIYGERLAPRVRSAEEAFGTQPGSSITGLFSPYLVDCAHAYDNHDGAHGVDGAHPSQGTRQTSALVQPFLIDSANGAFRTRRVRGLDEETSTVHAGGGNHALISPMPFLAAYRGTDARQRESWAIGADEPIGTVSAGGIHHALIGAGVLPFIVMRRGGNHAAPIDGVVPVVTAQGEAQHLVIQAAAQISLRDVNAMRVAGLDAELMTQGKAPQQALISRAPFLATIAFQHQSRESQARGIDEPMASVVGNDRDAVVRPSEELRVEDCYFRMLQPHEIGAAMAFPSAYVVHGNKRDRVKQFGNAVTPPAMNEQITRVVQAMTGERVA